MFGSEERSVSSEFGPGTDSDEKFDGWTSAPTGVRGVLPEGLGTMLPGAELGSVLASIDRSLLNGYELVVLARAERRQVMFYEASSLETVTELAHCPTGFAGSPPERTATVDEYTADELRPAFGWTRRAADRFLGLALDITERFPLVLREMKEGKIDVPKARVIVNTLGHLENRQIRQITEVSLGDAAEKTTGELGARLRRQAITCDPGSAKKSYEKGLTERYVEMYSNEDGTANITAHNLPVLAADRAMKRINQIAVAATNPSDHRSIDQTRADVFLDLLSGRQPNGDTDNEPEAGPKRSQRGVVDIRVDLTTLAGLNENPGTIPGWGPVIADIARQAANPKKVWQTTTVDEHGDIISTDITRPRPTTLQHREITTENPTCLFPGCRMPSTQSDIDHNHPRAKGGPTTKNNLGPLCRHDNLIKEHDWTLKRNPDRTYTWTSPHGHKHTTNGPDPP